MNSSDQEKRRVYMMWQNSNSDSLTDDDVLVIISNLYDRGMAEIWFIGMGWPEGYQYCKSTSYLIHAFIPGWRKDHFRAVWFACKFLQDAQRERWDRQE